MHQDLPAPIPTTYLRISTHLLLDLPPAPNPHSSTAVASQPPNITAEPLSPHHVYTIATPLTKLLPYSGDTVAWLLRIARLFFQPREQGTLWTHKYGTAQEWLQGELDDKQWRVVQPHEMLQGRIYEFRPQNDERVLLTMKSIRNKKSLTTRGPGSSSNQSKVFKAALIRRDQGCIVTKSPVDDFFEASHLVPKRMGDSVTAKIVSQFAGEDALSKPTRFHPAVGMLLSLELNAWMSSYGIGFYRLPNAVRSRILFTHSLSRHSREDCESRTTHTSYTTS